MPVTSEQTHHVAHSIDFAQAIARNYRAHMASMDASLVRLERSRTIAPIDQADAAQEIIEIFGAATDLLLTNVGQAHERLIIQTDLAALTAAGMWAAKAAGDER